MNTFTTVGRPLGLALAALLTLAAAPAARAQAPANDDPCGATVLLPNGALCNSPTTSTNVGATTTVPNGYTNPGFVPGSSGCGTATSPKDVWFQFTTTASGPSSFGVTVTVTGNPAGSLKLYSAASCAGPFTLLNCSAATTNNSVAARLTTGLLVANTTYYIQVAGYGSNDATGPFTICLTDGPAFPTCVAPRVGPFTNTGNGTGTVAFAPGANNTGPYSVTVRNNVTGNVQGPFANATSPLALTGLVGGNSYTVSVTTGCAGSGGQVTGTLSFAVPILNDEPCGAIALPVNATCVPTTGNSGTATASNVSTNGPASCANSPGSHDVWYTFTTAASGVGSTGVTVQTNLVTLAVGTMRVYRAASCAGPFTQLGCSTNYTIGGGGTPAPLVVSGLAPATTYYLRLDEGGAFGTGFSGLFTICVVGAVGCAAPSAFFAGVVTSATAPLFFTAGNGNQNYTITYAAAGGTPQTVTTAATNYTLTGLLPGTSYTASVVGNCGGGMASTPATTTFTTRVDNDEPCGAVPLPLAAGSPCQNAVYGSTGRATPTVPYGYANPGCNSSNTSNPDDVWFTFQTDASGPGSTGVELTLNGTYKQLRVFSAASCAGPFTELGCAGISIGQPTPLPLAVRGLTPGTTYFVRVAALYGSNGTAPNTFTLCARPAPACAPPTGLAVSAANSLSFTPGFGATSYAVTYQLAAGGPVQTVAPAPTASPVVLPGLVAGQPYTVAVVSDCGAGQTAAPASLTFVAGGCAARAYAPLPLTETFEQTWLSVCDVRDAPTGYWRNTPATGNTSWRRDDDGLVAGWSNPTTGAYAPTGAQGSAHSARFHTTFYTSVLLGDLDLLVDLSGASSKRLSFDYSNPDGPDSLKVKLSLDGGVTFQPLLQVGNAPAFTAQVVDFPASSATAVIRFTGQLHYGNTNTSDLGLDNVRVTPGPACASPFLSLAGLTATTASLQLAAGNGATSFTITYTSPGRPPQTVASNPTAGPVLLAGLSPLTIYTVTAVSNCAGATSTPPATLTFTTPNLGVPNDVCATATPVVPGVGTCPTPLLLANNSTANGNTAPVPNCGGAAVADLWYSVTVPANGVVEATTSAAPGSPVNDTALQLYSGTCGSLTNVRCNDNISTADLFSTARATGLVPGSTVYVRVWTYAGTATGAFNLCIKTDAACPAVTNLNVASTGTTATLTFAGPLNASGYTVSYTPAGGVAQTQPATASPVMLTGLQPFTVYTVSVTTNCTGGLTALPTSRTFTTIPYCATNLGAGCGNQVITAVVIPTTPLNNPSACNLTNGMPYTLYPATGSTTATLAAGSTYQLQVTANGTADLTAWIDYNHDGVFAASEATIVGQGVAANTAATASFTVPATALTGLTGMRVRSRQDGIGNGPADACTTFGSGETEDYFITLAAPPLPCLPPTAVAATALTATSASVGFAPAAGSALATAYTATALPTGGTVPVTATGPTAPLTLTGLAPNTAYSLTVTATCAGGASGPSAPPVAFRTLLASRSAALAAALGLFPNPAHAGATLTLPASLNPTGGTAELLDALGRTVGRWALAPGSTHLEVPLAGRAAGVYALRLRLGDDTAVKRLVVE